MPQPQTVDTAKLLKKCLGSSFSIVVIVNVNGLSSVLNCYSDPIWGFRKLRWIFFTHFLDQMIHQLTKKLN